MSPEAPRHRMESLLFSHRKTVIGLFLATTLLMGLAATRLQVASGFTKQLPMDHEYMKTYVQYRDEFGGANRVIIAVMARSGDMFTSDYFDTLKAVTDEVFFIPGINRPVVRSLFTPNVRFNEVVEDGISADNVIPGDFAPTPEGLETVRQNILKAGIVGRLVANDFSGSIVSAEFMEVDPDTGEKVDMIKIGRILEEKIRDKITSPPGTDGVDIHIIGFAKVISDIADGTIKVVGFFGIAFLLTAVLVFYYSYSLKLTVVSLACSLTAVIWQLGLLSLLGYSIDPMSILVPFLVFAIGVSHSVQVISSDRAELMKGASGFHAARLSFRRLLLPGCVALSSDTIGFVTIYFIKIRMIQELAIAAGLGVAVIILTNLFLLPVLLSYMHFTENYRSHLKKRLEGLEPVWQFFAKITTPRVAGTIILISAALLALGLWKAPGIKIGDLHRGVPELRANSRYNMDTQVISSKFSIGVDLISAIVETRADGCIDYDIMSAIDDFSWHMENVPGVASVICLPMVAKTVNAGWNEGALKWRVLPRNPYNLVQATAYIPTSNRLFNTECSVMPVMIFTADHKAETIQRVVSEIKAYRNDNVTPDVSFRLATGNVGIMAATNEVVAAAQFPILLYVFGAVILLCLVTFRSLRGTLCIVIPLGIVSLLAYALMTVLEIGLKVNTLPVVALGVGVGVDYGIYIYTRFSAYIKNGETLQNAFLHTVRVTGSGVMFTGITLGIGVISWIFSPLKFQADMGILLTFMFLVNMLGAIFLLPALARIFFPGK
jgi:predicted RND superfamily exporter protein